MSEPSVFSSLHGRPQSEANIADGHAIERARVVSVQRDSEAGLSTVWLESFQQNTCGQCSAQNACGQGVLQRWFSRRQRHYPVRCASSEAGLLAVGQWVEVAIPEGALSLASMLAYLMPLLGMIMAALLGEWLGFADLLVALIAGFGLYAGMLAARYFAAVNLGAAALEPRLLGPAA